MLICEPKTCIWFIVLILYGVSFSQYHIKQCKIFPFHIKQRKNFPILGFLVICSQNWGKTLSAWRSCVWLFLNVQPFKFILGSSPHPTDENDYNDSSWLSGAYSFIQYCTVYSFYTRTWKIGGSKQKVSILLKPRYFPFFVSLCIVYCKHVKISPFLLKLGWYMNFKYW